MDPRILDLGTSWRWVDSFTPRPLYLQGKSPDTHWVGGWVGPRTGLDDVEEKIFYLSATGTATPLPSGP
jgi:hypothetical protein